MYYTTHIKLPFILFDDTCIYFRYWLPQNRHCLQPCVQFLDFYSFCWKFSSFFSLFLSCFLSVRVFLRFFFFLSHFCSLHLEFRCFISLYIFFHTFLLFAAFVFNVTFETSIYRFYKYNSLNIYKKPMKKKLQTIDWLKLFRTKILHFFSCFSSLSYYLYVCVCFFFIQLLLFSRLL